jgi:hypothetical protein
MSSAPGVLSADGFRDRGAAACFLLIIRCWSPHADWSRRYGLDDVTSRRLGVLLVFLVLIFVYPMRRVFSSLFNVISGGYLPSGFTVGSAAEVPAMFIMFAVAFGLLGTVMCALYWHAWRQRGVLDLSLHECARTRFEIMNWAAVPAVSLLSLVLALAIPARPETGLWLGLPGFVFFLLNLAPLLMSRLAERWRRAQPGA